MIGVTECLDSSFFGLYLLNKLPSRFQETINLLSYSGGEKVNFDLCEFFFFNRIEIEIVQIRWNVIKILKLNVILCLLEGGCSVIAEQKGSESVSLGL